MKNTVILIIGPTAVGKTDLSIQIAQKYNTEIISSDSRQIYKELSVGTAVPNSQQLHTVKHNFIHSHSIHDYYNASKYENEVLNKLKYLFKSNNTIVMTGGSMLYIDAVCNGIDDLPKIDHEIRNELKTKFEKLGIENLRLELKKIDPEYYEIADLKNHKRLLHALEIFYITGKKYSSFRTNIKKVRDFKILKIGLNIERSILHNRINHRVDQMIEGGLVEEAKKVYQYKELNSLNTVGYKELFSYFDNDITFEKAIELIKRNTRRYARRQLTWFNKDKEINWFEPNDYENIMNFLDKTLS